MTRAITSTRLPVVTPPRKAEPRFKTRVWAPSHNPGKGDGLTGLLDLRLVMWVDTRTKQRVWSVQ